MKNGQIEKEVKKLAKQKKYEEIYQVYGPKYFRREVSEKYKYADIEKLEKQGRYIDIYEKYGEIDWTTYLIDLENELGRKPNLKERLFSPAILSRRIEKIKRFIIRLPINIPIMSLLFAGTSDAIKLGNYMLYKKEIQQYQKDIQEYSKAFDTNKQSDMEIIMRVQKDLHDSIKGYGEPLIDAFGYAGITLKNKESTGVCKNFSCNIVDKLNEINPSYNAREILLYAKYSNFENNNIENNIVQDKETIIKNIGNITEIYKNNVLKQRIIKNEDKVENYYFNDNGIINEYIENSETYYTSISYNEEGMINCTYFANEEGCLLTKYNKGKKTNKIVSNKNGQLLITYNEQRK